MKSLCALVGVLLIGCGGTEQPSDQPSCQGAGIGPCGGDLGTCCEGLQCSGGYCQKPVVKAPAPNTNGDPVCTTNYNACMATDATLAAAALELCVTNCDVGCETPIVAASNCPEACCENQCQGTCQQQTNAAKSLDDSTCATIEHTCICTCDGKCAQSC